MSRQEEDFRKRAEEYAKQLAHLFLGNGLSLQTILLMAIEFGQQHPHWISVEEELPEKDGRYWCCDDDDGQEELRWRDGHWYGLLDPYPIYGITHWMQLPTPPQGKEE